MSISLFKSLFELSNANFFLAFTEDIGEVVYTGVWVVV